MTLLGKSPYVYQISPDHLRQASKAPDFLQFGVLCMTLNHRINRLQHEQAGPLTERFYYYRGIALSSLNQRLRLTGRNTDDVALAGVLTILLVDEDPTRSGEFEESPAANPQYLVYGNAASPFHLCPPALFVEIIGINHLRQQALTNIKMQGLQQRAYDALQRIRNFSYAQWADSKPTSRVVWLLVGDAYRAATTLYCILSLQSQPVFLDTASLRGQCLSAGRNLQRLLEGPLSHQHIRRFMLWPLVILGVHAKTDGTMRSFVACELSNLSCQIGTYAPLTAKSMLERFWSSDETGWDACFDKPYAFTMQIAVDTSGIIDPL
ncbi:C6 zinc finger domain-containing protein [Purpureocillium lavendulum]|uniref:C6 zinc finger domain-containing protein n=1 Tax=Purpureocillium lavendulum TaxID=1247861 RepID=A0AB34FJK4_9HYPO|nr:C6 zinc finger domain-containing protein [Purpureocillium lavendulum]